MTGLEALIIFLVIAILALAVYSIWDSRRTTTTTTTTSPTGPDCFPDTTIPVVGGLIDLRSCNDQVYIIRSRTDQVTYLDVSP